MKKFLNIMGGILAVIGGFFLMAVVIALVAVMTEDDTASSKAPESTPSLSTPEVTDPPSQSAELVYADSWDEIHAGSIVDIGSFSITYWKCDSDWRGYDSSYKGAHDGKKIIRAYFSFENISTTDQGCYRSDFSCYADGIACELYRYYYAEDDDLTTGLLSPGRIAQGYVYFEVPVDAGEIELEYAIWGGQEKLIFIIE